MPILPSAKTANGKNKLINIILLIEFKSLTPLKTKTQLNALYAVANVILFPTHHTIVAFTTLDSIGCIRDKNLLLRRNWIT